MRRNHLGSFSYFLAAVLSAEALDLLVGHRGGAVGVEKFPAMTSSKVVLEGPHAGGEILARIAQPGLSDVDQPGQHPVADQDVRQAVVTVDEDVAALFGAEGTVRGVRGMNGPQDLSEYPGDA